MDNETNGKTYGLQGRVSAIEARETERKEQLDGYRSLVDNLKERVIVLELALHPLITAREGQIMDRTDFWKMMVGAVITMALGIIGVAVASPAVQRLLGIG